MSVNVTSPADSGPGSFRSAINSVNALTASTINFMGAFTIILLSPLPTIAQHVTINGAGSTVDGNGQFYCLRVSPLVPGSPNITINELTFTNGANTNDNAGLRIDNCTVALTTVNVTNCVSTYNVATTFGVGLSLINCDTTIAFGSMSNNTVILDVALASDMFVGIGMYVNSGSINVTGPQIINNTYTTSTTFGSLSGGVHIVNVGSGIFDLCTIDSNTSKSNAGIYVDSSTFSLIDTQIVNNIATLTGGGLGASNSIVTLNASGDGTVFIVGNTAATQGGGMHLTNNSSLLTAVGTNDILIQGNILNGTTTVMNGAGISCTNSFVNIENIIFDSNVDQTTTSSVRGGGLYIAGNSVGNIVNNCIFNNNTAWRGCGLFTSLVNDITVTNCSFNGNTTPVTPLANSIGGGIFCTGITNYSGLTITNNSCGLGGGIYIDANAVFQPIVSALPSTISGNTATSNGGGLYVVSASIILDNCTVQNNIATSDGGGAAIIGDGTYSILNCLIDSNTCGNFGGGIFSASTTIDISNTIIQSNTAVNGANIYSVLNSLNISNSNIINGIVSLITNTGGILTIGTFGVMNLSYCNINNNVGNGINTIGATIISNCNIANNNTGIMKTSGALTISNSTIGINTVTGISSDSADATITNATIARNATGIINTSGIISVVNTIIASNTTADATGTFNSLGYNLVQNTAGSVGFTQPTDITGVDPLLDSYADNGGPTETMALLIGSPALDAGNTAAAIGPYDQRGPGFSRIINGMVDIGAFESQFVVCFIGESLLLVQDILTGIIDEIQAKFITSDRYLIYNHSKKIFEAIIYNIVTYKQNRFIKIAKDLFNDIPTADIYITSGHYVSVNGKFIKAKDVPGKKVVYLDHQNVYTICLRNSGSILLNGLPVKAYGLNEWNTYSKNKKVIWHNNATDDSTN